MQTIERVLSSKLFGYAKILYTFLIAACLLTNFYFLFQPVQFELHHDGAEHLHVAYLMNHGERPFVDFLENHPMLFNHYLGWMKNVLHIKTTLAWAHAARWTIFLHFLFFLFIAGLWISKVLKKRPEGVAWIALLVTALALMDFNRSIIYPIWEIRPDFICYAYTLFGCYLVYISFQNNNYALKSIAILMLGGFFIGIGNAILPKGTPIILGILLAIVTVSILEPKEGVHKTGAKKILIMASVTGISIAAAFVAGVWLDCALSKISPDTWISAVLWMNSKKHIIYRVYEDNPITILLAALSLSPLTAIMLATWIVWKLARVRSDLSKNRAHCYLLLTACYTIVINLLIAPFSNGVTWSYNFIPAVFSLTVIILILVLDISTMLSSKRLVSMSTPAAAGIFAICFLMAVQVFALPLQLSTKMQSRSTSKRLTRYLGLTDYVADALCPKGFTYFAYYPNLMPVQSRHWGFYFMLPDNSNFWRDYHSLGIGPDAKKIYGHGFGKNPPDALLFTQPDEVNTYIFMLRQCQGINASWLLKTIKTQYTPMQTKGIWMYVRNDKVEYMLNRGWVVAHNLNSLRRL